jgi:hypothetical protein
MRSLRTVSVTVVKVTPRWVYRSTVDERQMVYDLRVLKTGRNYLNMFVVNLLVRSY